MPAIFATEQVNGRPNLNRMRNSRVQNLSKKFEERSKTLTSTDSPPRTSPRTSPPNSPNEASRYFEQINMERSPSPGPQVNNIRNQNGRISQISQDITAGIQKKIAEMITDIDRTSSKMDDLNNSDEMDISATLSFPQDHQNDQKDTSPVNSLQQSIPNFSNMRRKNDESLKILIKTCQDMIKNNIKVIKQVHEEKVQLQALLDECKGNKLELKQQADDEKEYFQQEINKFQVIEKKYQKQISDMSDVIDKMRGEIADQRMHMDVQNDIFNNLTVNFWAIIEEFGNVVKVNEESLLNEKKLQGLFGECQTLLKSFHNKFNR